MLEKQNKSTFVFLDGVRGIGAIVVLLAHYASAFLPVFARVTGLAHYRWEAPLTNSPIFSVVYGSVFLYAFFLTSGFVLTRSYFRAETAIGQILKRVVRLFLPSLASFLIAVILLALLPQFQEKVVPDTQSIWAQRLHANPMTALSLAKDMLLNVPLLGYRGGSIFDPVDAWMGGAPLSPITTALNPALWTMSMELWGSMIVLLMTRLYRLLPRPWFWAAFAASFLVAGTGYLSLFLLGFAAYLALRHAEFRGLPNAPVTGTVLVLGIFLASGWRDVFPFDLILGAARHVSLLNAPFPITLQTELAAAVMLAGIVMAPALRRMLTSPWVLWLGRHSFSLYLVHFPLLFTVDFAFFAFIRPHLPYGAAAALSTIVGCGLSLAAAVPFERWVDRPARQLADRIGRWKPRFGNNPQAPAAELRR